MSSRLDPMRFAKLYKGTRRSTSQQLLQEELALIELAGADFFAKLACRKLFQHNDLHAIPIDRVEEFINEVDELVCACLEAKERMLKQ